MFKLLKIRAWPLSLVAFLAGFTLVAIVVAVLAVVATPWPSGIPESYRNQVETAGATRGLFLAQQEARENAIDEAQRRASEELPSLTASESFDLGYQPTYRYAWNDAIETLSRRVPRQRLHEEEHTQWIELRR